MAKESANDTTNEYWADKQRFADLMNGMLFHGRLVLHAEDLQELDSAYPTTIKKKGSYSLTRYRDVVKMAAYGAEFHIVAGIENQNKIHYAMPVRGALYDALGYVRQCKQIAAEHTNRDYADDAEYLSRFCKTDQLIPIFTVTLYYGEQPWDGPVSLLDMMRVDEALREYCNDYRINLVSVREMTNWRVFRTEVAQFFQLMNSLKDIDALHRYIEEHPDMEIDIETIHATAIAADSKDLRRLAEKNKRKGKIRMCTAIEDLKREGRSEGEVLSLVTLVRKKQGKGIGAAELAEFLEEDTAKIQLIYDAISENLEVSDDELVEMLMKK